MGLGRQTSGFAELDVLQEHYYLRRQTRWIMTVTTLSSRDLNQDIGRAKTASKHGPVFITAPGKPGVCPLPYGKG